MKQNDEVVYSIVVPGLNSAAKRDHAHKVLGEAGVPSHLRIVNANVLTVKRLCTRWKGDDEDLAWQQAIKTALPEAIIDVQPWSTAPGYPQGDLTL